MICVPLYGLLLMHRNINWIALALLLFIWILCLCNKHFKFYLYSQWNMEIISWHDSMTGSWQVPSVPLSTTLAVSTITFVVVTTWGVAKQYDKFPHIPLLLVRLYVRLLWHFCFASFLLVCLIVSVTSLLQCLALVHSATLIFISADIKWHR